ncbi:MAG: sodium-dependent transporter [Kiritimatiellae bacterium]|nr:sodium-dependent transporter [Kiritimatiellia bacterium]
MKETNRASWSGQLAFVLAAAASAIGLGNLWRFPYLAAKYGGGVFIAAYLILSLTLGFTLLITEIALGRYSRQSQITVFGKLGHKKWNFLGVLATIVPLVILPYYNVIGGWVVKYFVAYVKCIFCSADTLSDPNAFFASFITAPWEPFVYMVIFSLVVSFVILLGVKNGIEKSNLVMMPILFLMAIGIAIYVATLPNASVGIKYYLIPDFSNCDNFGKVILGAMGQMFYSLSLAMGIMITYGSYMKRRNSIPSASVRIVAADTFVAVLSGFIIIPVVVIFAANSGVNGKVAIEAGPGLMFETLPKVFSSLGVAGPYLGLIFFTLVLFAALTSSISMTEACVAAIGDYFKTKRKSSTFAITLWALLLGSVSAFGYGRWESFKPFGMPALDFFDFSMNSILMPIVAALTCYFVGWVLSPKRILAECHRHGGATGFKYFYIVMVKFIAPLLVIAILISEVCRAFNIGGWSI